MNQLSTDLGTVLLGEGFYSLGQFTGGNGCYHIHHVYIRNIVQLARPAFAHTDNRQIQGIYGCTPRGCRAQSTTQTLGNFGAGYRERSFQSGGGKISKMPPNRGHKFHRIGRTHINKRNFRECGTVRHAQRRIPVFTRHLT